MGSMTSMGWLAVRGCRVAVPVWGWWGWWCRVAIWGFLITIGLTCNSKKNIRKRHFSLLGITTRPLKYTQLFSNFSSRLEIPVKFSNLNFPNLSYQIYRNKLKTVSYQKFFRPSTVSINCSTDVKIFEKTSNLTSFSITRTIKIEKWT